MSFDAKQMIWRSLQSIRLNDPDTLSAMIDNLRVQWLAALAAGDEDEQAELGRWIPALTDEYWILAAHGREEVAV